MYKFDNRELTIGSKVFVVHRSYAFQKKLGGKVLLARVVGFENRTGSVDIVFRLVGQSSKGLDLTVQHYVPFVNINKAIEAISI